MKQKDLSEFTDQELFQEEKKRKSTYTSFNFIFGMLTGVAIYSSVKNGFGFLTFLPLFFVPFGIMNRTNYRAVEKEILSHNLR